jgi:hypothetical protein
MFIIDLRSTGKGTIYPSSIEHATAKSGIVAADDYYMPKS